MCLVAPPNSRSRRVINARKSERRYAAFPRNIKVFGKYLALGDTETYVITAKRDIKGYFDSEAGLLQTLT